MVELRRLLAEARSPLMGDLMAAFSALLKEYRGEVEEILVADKQARPGAHASARAFACGCGCGCGRACVRASVSARESMCVCACVCVCFRGRLPLVWRAWCLLDAHAPAPHGQPAPGPRPGPALRAQPPTPTPNTPSWRGRYCTT
jgi:hypothetical protein